MIKYTSGNILHSNAEAIINTVNCVGVMGRGIALQFKKTYPENFKAYAEVCKKNQLSPGKMFVFETQELTNPRLIINFPTKRHWRGASKIEDIEIGLESLKKTISDYKINSIAIPPLGSGLGGLNWNTVKLKIEHALKLLTDVKIIVYEPKGRPDIKVLARNRAVPKMTNGRAVLIELIERYLGGLLDPSITLLEIHKLLYFAQEIGEPLKLKYKKGSYGPYAENLRHVLNTIEGHFISGYADGGDDPRKSLELVPGATLEAKEYLTNKKETLKRFHKVSDLVDGFESSFGLELLATVHWLIKKEKLENEEEVIKATHSWNSMKRKFSPRQIRIALNRLIKEKWINFDLN